MKSGYSAFWAMNFLLAASLLSSCEDKLEADSQPAPASSNAVDTGAVMKKGFFRGMPITYQLKNGKAIWQGDIHLTAEDLAQGSGPTSRVSGLGLKNVNKRWHNWTINYVVSDDIPDWQFEQIKKAIAYWEAKTPIRFKPQAQGYSPDFVRFVANETVGDNWSEVGRTGGMQEISLSDNAGAATIAHEIGHAIGLFHEHTRSDRDKYVKVQWENIRPGLDSNFAIVHPDVAFDFGPYDFKSIMHYGPFHGTKNLKATLVRKDGQFMEENDEPSTGDAKTVKAMYSNLYIVHSGTLYGANSKNGAYVNYPANWSGTAKTIAVWGPHIYTMQSGKLWKTERLTGKFESIGNGNWTNAVGVTGFDPQGYMYAQAGTRLWKIDSYGNYTRLGGPKALENWTGTQAVYYHNKGLYVIWNNTLYKINTTSGMVDKTYGGLWKDVKGMAAPDPNSKFLYIIINTSLWKVDVVSGALTEVSYNTFPSVQGMTYASGAPESMIVVSGGGLYGVSQNGTKRFLTAGWLGTEAMGGF